MESSRWSTQHLGSPDPGALAVSKEAAGCWDWATRETVIAALASWKVVGGICHKLLRAGDSLRARSLIYCLFDFPIILSSLCELTLKLIIVWFKRKLSFCFVDLYALHEIENYLYLSGLAPIYLPFSLPPMPSSLQSLCSAVWLITPSMWVFPALQAPTQAMILPFCRQGR